MAETDWIRIIKENSVSEGVSEYTRNGNKFAVIKKNGQIKRVVENRCPHNPKYKLSVDYELTESEITCNFHGACFSLQDGDRIDSIDNSGLQIYDHRIVDGYIEANLGE